ncbi:TonB-dependent receptor [Ramlibacter sp. AW1]|uniref:TonB-dependent receptor n=1 Tax=Ramlibacter aurantiacus TaxID=2801330 RepID=A0A936ZSC1_9BURK|nr:TonB-dependent receptor [Ramlibacter aurantiacus]MBL0421661.1 TonB-dependent receptor [Ramlibacter aurantiacus]
MPPTRMPTTMLAALILMAAVHSPPAHARNSASVADLSLEELSNIMVTSVSGRPQTLRSAAASIYVITSDEIRRSAATTLPEALRLAPNLHVARLNAGQWAISARGFNTAIANKLLVLVDGRTIYSPLFAGVFWDFHDLPLEDIERIEVISGPGGTLWGANAVNGIINVVTSPAAATQGPMVSVTRSHHGGQQTARLGFRNGPGHLRVYAMALDRADTRTATGLSLADSSSKQQAGFRGDWDLGVHQLTLQGDAFTGGALPSNNTAPDISGGNFSARLESRLPDGSPLRVQLSLDEYHRDDTNLFRNRSRSTDLQFTHELARQGRHQWVWGGGYRSATDINDTTALVTFDPAERTLAWWNLFVQDQVRLGERAELTLGLKAERNSYTGLEWLPTARIAWRHLGGATTWAAASRAVRAPSRIDREFYFPGAPPFVIAGGPRFDSEVAKVYEVGHRGDLGRTLSYDLTLFRQQYSGLRAGTAAVPTTVENLVEGTADGLEAWAHWNPLSVWRLSAGYTRLHKKLRFSGPAPANAANGIAAQGNDPRHLWKLRSRLDIGSRYAFDLALRHVGALPQPAIPSYTTVDARLGWAVSPSLELSLLAQNLLDPAHPEFESATGSQVRRQLWLRAVWQP